MQVSLDDIRKAHKLVGPTIIRTQLNHSNLASRRMNSKVYLKLENEQRTGSFKIRGALNKISSLTAAERARGVVACSAGNHAQGVALSCSELGVKCHVVMPVNSPLVKISATEGYGAEVILKGDFFDESFRHATQLAQEKGYIFVHPYEDPAVIAGQGTIGLEVFEDLPDVDTMLVPIGGGGLISGIATAIKSLRPQCRVIGVQSDQAPGMCELYHKREYHPKSGGISTIADGIAIKYPSQVMFDSFISRLVDEVVVVNDAEMAEAIVFLIETARTVVEGSGAAAFAAALSGKVKLGAKTCIVISGGNIDLNIVSHIIEKGLQKKGRLARLSVVVPDSPGSLSRLTKAIADKRANILEVHHDRVSARLSLKETRIDFVLETTSLEHIDEIRTAFHELGARIADQ